MKPAPEDVFALVGLTLAAIGAWLLHPAAGLLVLGCGFWYIGIWHGR